ncbi:zinc carboxypeptidase A 1 isoform X2 [Eurytemora carolleeae]|nr:zinc carboxypeptidase A 1 isoform X2 [Eurytemora carolleeae]|eukprot:XP_023328996.1 zinc carboxypeptidase A 1-like isoform X2 [Eurytemora affinis]
MHAREWISPATCLYIIQKLVIVFETVRRTPFEHPVLDYQWQIAPMMNPDGYNKSHYDNRLQRKNGRPLNLMSGYDMKLNRGCLKSCKINPDECLGVDLNRNFPSGFGQGYESFEIDSNLICSDVYKGPTYLSEPETQALHNYILRIRKNILSAISIHCYSMVISYPNGWMKKGDKNQVTGKDLNRFKSFVKTTNTFLNYKTGFVYEVFGEEGVSGGATDDYYYNYHDIKISLTLELDPDSSTSNGFVISPKKIIPIANKLWKTFQLIADKMKDFKEELMELNKRYEQKKLHPYV